MSERLKQLIKDYRGGNGKRWKEKLCVKADVSISSLQKVLAGQLPVSYDLALSVALACEAKKEEAQLIAEECSSEAKRAG